MRDIGKAPAGARGGGQMTTAANQLSTPQYNRKSPKKQAIRDLSNLLDQALFFTEFHGERAEFHRLQAERHRAVLRSLQTLIPRYQFNTEGEISNG